MAKSADIFRSGEPETVAIVRVIREVTETRFRLLETMILEERQNRINDVAEIRDVLSKMSDEASAACSNSSTKSSGKALSNDAKYMPQVSSETASTEMAERTRADSSATELQFYADLITEQRHHVASQLEELESMLLSNAERATLLDGTLSTMQQLSAIIQETNPGTLPEPESIPATTLAPFAGVQTLKTGMEPEQECSQMQTQERMNEQEADTGATALFGGADSTGSWESMKGSRLISADHSYGSAQFISGEGGAATFQSLKPGKDGDGKVGPRPTIVPPPEQLFNPQSTVPPVLEGKLSAMVDCVQGLYKESPSSVDLAFAASFEALDPGKEYPVTTGLASEARKERKPSPLTTIRVPAVAVGRSQSSDSFRPYGTRLSLGETAKYFKTSPPTSPVAANRSVRPRDGTPLSKPWVTGGVSAQDISKASPSVTLNTSKNPYPGRAVAASCKRKCQPPRSSFGRPSPQCHGGVGRVLTAAREKTIKNPQSVR